MWSVVLMLGVLVVGLGAIALLSRVWWEFKKYNARMILAAREWELVVAQLRSLVSLFGALVSEDENNDDDEREVM